jgi:hypothetical protein
MLEIISDKRIFRSKLSMARDSQMVVTGFIRNDALQDSYLRAIAKGECAATRSRETIPDLAITTQLPFNGIQENTFYNLLPLPASTGLPVNYRGQGLPRLRTNDQYI